MESGIGNMGDNLEIQLMIAFVNELLVMKGKNEGTRSAILCRREATRLKGCVEVGERGT